MMYLELRDVFGWIMDADTSIAAPPAHRSTNYRMFSSMLRTYFSIPGTNNNQSSMSDAIRSIFVFASTCLLEIVGYLDDDVLKTGSKYLRTIVVLHSLGYKQVWFKP